MIWSHIESSYQRYGEFQGNLPGSVCWALNQIPVFFAVSKRPCGGRDWSAPRNSPQDHGPPQGQHRTVPTPQAVNSEVASSLSRGCWFSLIFMPSASHQAVWTLTQEHWDCHNLFELVIILGLRLSFRPSPSVPFSCHVNVHWVTPTVP